MAQRQPRWLGQEPGRVERQRATWAGLLEETGFSEFAEADFNVVN